MERKLKNRIVLLLLSFVAFSVFAFTVHKNGGVTLSKEEATATQERIQELYTENEKLYQLSKQLDKELRACKSRVEIHGT